MQALGMKLLRKKDVPDYKVPSHIWGWKNGCQISWRWEKCHENCGLLSILDWEYIFGLVQYTIAMLGYADEDKTTVLELTYNYGRTEYSKGNAYAQVCMESDG